MEDKLLVYRCKRGSQEALTQIYNKYKRNLLLLAMSLLNDRTVSEDVVHDVFVSFVKGLDDFQLTGSLKSYLMTCVANHARNQITDVLDSFAIQGIRNERIPVEAVIEGSAYVQIHEEIWRDAIAISACPASRSLKPVLEPCACSSIA